MRFYLDELKLFKYACAQIIECISEQKYAFEQFVPLLYSSAFVYFNTCHKLSIPR